MSSVIHSSAIFIAAGSFLQSEGKLRHIALNGGRSSRGDTSVRRSFVPKRIERSDFRRRPDLASPSHKNRSHGVAMMAHKSAPEGELFLLNFILGTCLSLSQCSLGRHRYSLTYRNPLLCRKQTWIEPGMTDFTKCLILFHNHAHRHSP